MPGQSPLFIPPAFKPPGTSGPGGNLVGPGSSIFQPRDPDEFYPEIDPATGGGIPFMGGNDPNDLFPSIPGINDPRLRQPQFPRGRGGGPGFRGPGGFGPSGGFNPNGGFGGGFGGFYS